MNPTSQHTQTAAAAGSAGSLAIVLMWIGQKFNLSVDPPVAVALAAILAPFDVPVAVPEALRETLRQTLVRLARRRPTTTRAPSSAAPPSRAAARCGAVGRGEALLSGGG